MIASLLALLLTLPAAEQLTVPSLPKALGDLLRAKLAPADAPFATFEVRHFQARGQAGLWILGWPCPPESHGGSTCSSDLYLQAGKRFSLAGSAPGALVEVDFAEGQPELPDQLYFYVGTGPTEVRLRRMVSSYEPTRVAHRFRDPLTQEALDAPEMRKRAVEDFRAGRTAAAAGRYQLLCDAQCEVADLEALAAMDLSAHLLPQAENALRAALAMPGHQPDDWKSLAALLRAEGRNADASDVEAARPAAP